MEPSNGTAVGVGAEIAKVVPLTTMLPKSFTSGFAGCSAAGDVISRTDGAPGIEEVGWYDSVASPVTGWTPSEPLMDWKAVLVGSGNGLPPGRVI